MMEGNKTGLATSLKSTIVKGSALGGVGKMASAENTVKKTGSNKYNHNTSS